MTGIEFPVDKRGGHCGDLQGLPDLEHAIEFFWTPPTVLIGVRYAFSELEERVGTPLHTPA